MGNTYGKVFTVTSFGESHGKCIGVVVDGCPAGLSLSAGYIQEEVDRRRPASGTFATTRVEKDKVEILSGVFKDCTTGAPICMLVRNEDVNSKDYTNIASILRPGHADFTAFMKYGGFNDYRGSGRFSGRITAGFVMAGAVAKKLLQTIGVTVFAHTMEIGGVKAGSRSYAGIRENVDKDSLRCADPEASGKMLKAIEEAKAKGDSIGGIVEGIALNLPVGLGEPVFDTLDGELAKAVLAIPSIKGVEFGAGFAAARLQGSENNDSFVVNDGSVRSLTNNAGGVLGGLSTGMPLVLRAVVKPTPSIAQSQETVDIKNMQPASLKVKGRHDTCIVPRVVPVVEAMMAVTLCDFVLLAGKIARVLP